MCEAILFLAAVCPAFAQADVALPPHAVTFAASGNAIELEVAVPVRLGAAPEVVVASAPAWLPFYADRADAVATEGETPVAAFTFDVDRTAPVGRPADVVFEVRLGGAVVAEHVVRLVVEAPAELSLDAPSPNPSRGAVTVPFEVPEAGRVWLAAYDVLGREVAVLVDEERPAGAHEARIEAGALAAGVYVFRLDAGPEADVRRLTVVR